MANRKAATTQTPPATPSAQVDNTHRWYLLEHQLQQARISIQTARSQAEQIQDVPENDEDWAMAEAALEILSSLYIATLKADDAFRRLATQSELAERMGGFENG